MRKLSKEMANIVVSLIENGCTIRNVSKRIIGGDRRSKVAKSHSQTASRWSHKIIEGLRCSTNVVRKEKKASN